MRVHSEESGHRLNLDPAQVGQSGLRGVEASHAVYARTRRCRRGAQIDPVHAERVGMWGQPRAQEELTGGVRGPIMPTLCRTGLRGIVTALSTLVHLVPRLLVLVADVL